MCISPSFIYVQRGPNQIKQPKPCGVCWRCKKNRINDYTARALCEASTSAHVATVSMTYAPRHDMADKVVEPRHFQLFIKLLRRAGHKVRYLVAGEYGDLRGRAHFHAILFFEHLVPLEYENEHGEWITRGIPAQYKDDYPLGKTQEDAPFSDLIPHKRMVHIREWPHGHIEVDWSASEAAIRYVCWYLQLPEKHNAWFSLSKKPPLGAAYFAQRAERFRKSGLLPQGFEYVPPGGDKAKTYLLTGASRRDYLNAITQDPKDLPRLSKWVAKTFEKHEKARVIEFLREHEVNSSPDRLRREFLVANKSQFRANAKHAAFLKKQFWQEKHQVDFSSPVQNPEYFSYRAAYVAGAPAQPSFKSLRRVIRDLITTGQCSTYDELAAHFRSVGHGERFEKLTVQTVNTINAARESGALYYSANNPDFVHDEGLKGPCDSAGRTAGHSLYKAD